MGGISSARHRDDCHKSGTKNVPHISGKVHNTRWKLQKQNKVTICKMIQPERSDYQYY